MFARPTIGLERTTYLIDEEGIIIKAFDKVNQVKNPKQMLDELD
ncbi:hypothetical protein PXD04_07870 [Methanosphaera sp. ISO3-F5]|nr:hypothetical protein [Methanosphaera sp. ISO3-F5]WQH63612.1 hypothetical protein PXD04_07870 [Methanosphaera sp. ISO3-F5]